MGFSFVAARSMYMLLERFNGEVYSLFQLWLASKNIKKEKRDDNFSTNSLLGGRIPSDPPHTF